ncbi:MAG: glycoside hydrolase family 97 catalytic domain-containing protein [Bacteroidota bacterium]
MKNAKIHILRFLVVPILLVVLGCRPDPKENLRMTFGKTQATLLQTKGKQLALSITREDKIVMDTSLLGIKINTKELGINSNIQLLREDKISLSYPLNGIKNQVNYQADQFTYNIEESDGYIWQLLVQISDQGVAYRYAVPGEGKRRVYGELSSFKLPKKTRVWYFERDNDWKLKSHAGEWRVADISQMPTVSKMGPIQGLTLTCELPHGGYALLAEAALFNYSGLRLEAIGDNTFRANFTEGEKGFEIDGDILSPWRCILIADNLNDLANNTLVPSLSPPPDEKIFSDVSWIKPGKSVWHWWSGKYLDFEEEKAMIEDAEALHFEYSMVDDGWEEWEDKWEKIRHLSELGEQKGVGIFVWKHSKEINFPENDYAVMGHFLDSVEQTGAVGVKVDFMNGQSKSLIQFDEALLRKAAERQLMVNFHGCQQSSGEYRTYPNEVTREGIRGLEVNHMKEGPLPASHNVALPFTRYVTGHADYTPLGFTEPGETTWGHQLGTLVAFYSPFNCIAENTQFLLNDPNVRPALNFIREVPAVWDETLVLPQSKIGELAAIARRKGEDWYIGILSSVAAKEVSIDCNFLHQGEYRTEIFLDDLSTQPIDLEGLNPEADLRQWNTAIPFKRVKRQVSSAEQLQLQLASNGGAAISLKKI